MSDDMPQASGGTEAGADVDELIRRQFTGVLEGKIKRYTPEMKERQKSQFFSEMMARQEAEGEALETQLTERGITRGGVMARGRTEVKKAALQEYGKAVNAMELQAAMSEYDDKMAALNQAQQWLNGRRQYELGKEANAIASANVALGYARLEAEKEIARTHAGAARASLQLGQEQFEFEKQRYEESKITLPNGDRVPTGTYDRMMDMVMSGL